jgi:hypothetical protein
LFDDIQTVGAPQTANGKGVRRERNGMDVRRELSDNDNYQITSVF